MIITKYKNGNTKVTIMNDGTKIREYKNLPQVQFPESIDIKITDYCNMGCNFCFLPNMEVLTLNGNINISEIVVGEQVYSKNLETSNIGLETVQDVIIKEIDEDIIIITLENNNIIKCTSNHEIYTLNRGWVKAQDLNEYDELDNIF